MKMVTDQMAVQVAMQQRYEKIIYFREKKNGKQDHRIITIVYRWLPNGKILYAGVNWTKTERDFWNKKLHRKVARDRSKLCPVLITMDTDKIALRQEREKVIRKSLFTNGVKGERSKC